MRLDIHMQGLSFKNCKEGTESDVIGINVGSESYMKENPENGNIQKNTYLSSMV